MNKTFIRFFTIADYEEEERWLRDQQKSGWKLVKTTPPCFYTFESCTPQDVIYRLDYKNSSETDEYMQMLRDFGWENCGRCIGWLYFRKSADATESAEEGELFSDNSSRIHMIRHILKTRYFPLCVIFLCCIVNNLSNAFRMINSGTAGIVFGLIFWLLFLLYIFLLTYCGIKLMKLKNKYR